MGIAIGAQAQDSHSFVKQYSQQDGFTVVTLNKATMRLATLLARVSNPKDDVSILHNVDNVQILTTSSLAEDRFATFENELEQFCATGHYDLILESEANGGTDRLFCKFTDDSISGFVIWSKKDRVGSMVCLNGRFTEENMKKIMVDGWKNAGLGGNN
jgi:hypothetical protein